MGKNKEDMSDEELAVKMELKRQMKAISAAGGKMFPNIQSVMMAYENPSDYLSRNKPGYKGGGWGSWGGSWTNNSSSMKSGGVVRGCGKAERGRTKGKMR